MQFFAMGEERSERMLATIALIAPWKFIGTLDTLLTSRLNSSSFFATKRLIKHLRQLKVKDVSMINLHGKYLHEKLFLDYLIEDHINLVYIMADESAFLGNCPYSNGCTHYMDGCKDCPQQKAYQRLLFPNVPAKAFGVKQNAYPQINAHSWLLNMLSIRPISRHS